MCQHRQWKGVLWLAWYTGSGAMFMICRGAVATIPALAPSNAEMALLDQHANLAAVYC